MSIVHLWNDTVEKPKYLGQDLSHCHFSHPKRHNGLAWDQPLVFPVRGWWLAFWAMVWVTVFDDHFFRSKYTPSPEKLYGWLKKYPYIKKEWYSMITILM